VFQPGTLLKSSKTAKTYNRRWRVLGVSGVEKDVTGEKQRRSKMLSNQAKLGGEEVVNQGIQS